MNEQPELTTITSCYFEEKSIDEFYTRLKAVLESLGCTYEMVFVNDGSTDGTWEKLNAIYERDHSVSAIIDLCKNSGQAAAITAALGACRGKAYLLLDSDLQLDPEQLPLLYAEYQTGIYDLVTGYRVNRKDSFSRIIPSKLANIIMRKASRSALLDFGCTFKIYRGDFVRAFECGPHHILSNVEFIRCTRRVKEIPINHRPRKFGKSGWTFAKLWQYNMDNIVLLLERPFQYLAALSALGGALLVLRVIVGAFASGSILHEVSNGLLLNAIAFSMLTVTGALALVGEFGVRSFAKLLRLPAYIVREKRSRAVEDQTAQGMPGTVLRRD